MLVLLHNFAKASSFAALAVSAIAAVLRVVWHECSIAVQRYRRRNAVFVNADRAKLAPLWHACGETRPPLPEFP